MNIQKGNTLITNWIVNYQYEQDDKTKLWCYWDTGLLDKNEYTTKELFNMFKEQTINE